MALKGDRFLGVTDISFFMDAAAEKGGCVTIKTAGSGAALDQSAAEVQYAASPSGYASLGILLNDMVNVDLTKYHVNFQKDEVQKGGKVTVLLDGWVVTNMIYPGITPTAGQKAYVSYSGYISNAAVTDDGTIDSDLPIGRFLSTKDEDGYAKVYVKLPTV